MAVVFGCLFAIVGGWLGMAVPGWLYQRKVRRARLEAEQFKALYQDLTPQPSVRRVRVGYDSDNYGGPLRPGEARWFQIALARDDSSPGHMPGSAVSNRRSLDDVTPVGVRTPSASESPTRVEWNEGTTPVGPG